MRTFNRNLGILTVLLSTLVLSACEDYSMDALIPAEYNKILSLQEYDEQDIVLYNGKENVFTITALKCGSKPELTAGATIDAMTTVEYREYITETNLPYIMIPSMGGYYTFSAKDLNFDANVLSQKVTLSVDALKVKEFMDANPGATCIIPIVLSSPTDTVLTTAKRLIYRIKNVDTPTLSFKDVPGKNINLTVEGMKGGSVAIPFSLQVDNQWDLRAKIEVDAAETTLSAGDYTLTNDGIITLAPGQNVAELNVTIAPKKAGTIALKIVSLEGGQGFDFDKKVVAVNVGIADIPEDQLVKYELKAENATASDNATKYDGPGADDLANLLDGDMKTFWQSDWVGKQSNSYVQFVLDTPISDAFVFSYATRERVDGVPTSIRILVGYEKTAGASNGDTPDYDETNLVEIASFVAADGLPNQPHTSFTSPVVWLDKPVSVIRWQIYGPQKFFGISELSVFTLKDE